MHWLINRTIEIHYITIIHCLSIYNLFLQIQHIYVYIETYYYCEWMIVVVGLNRMQNKEERKTSKNFDDNENNGKKEIVRNQKSKYSVRTTEIDGRE